MRLACRFTVAATAWLLIAGFSLLLSTMESQAQAPAGICKDSADLTVLPSPLAPWTGAPLRVMVVTEKPLKGVFSLTAPDGRVAAKASDRHGGAPHFLRPPEAAPPGGG
ncbi:MAG TPA: hypothetical protein DCR50_10155, partial [Afipia sp.]|nr:hypothetical protein [Afipia sp.]